MVERTAKGQVLERTPKELNSEVSVPQGAGLFCLSERTPQGTLYSGWEGLASASAPWRARLGLERGRGA